MIQKQVELWVCPTPECGSFYGSSSQVGRDLASEETLARVEDRDQQGKRRKKGHRSDCPDCKQAGRGTVERRRVVLEVRLPDGGVDEKLTAPPIVTALGPDNSDAT